VRGGCLAEIVHREDAFELSLLCGGEDRPELSRRAQLDIDAGGARQKTSQERTPAGSRKVVQPAFCGMPRGDDERCGKSGQDWLERGQIAIERVEP